MEKAILEAGYLSRELDLSHSIRSPQVRTPREMTSQWWDLAQGGESHDEMSIQGEGSVWISYKASTLQGPSTSYHEHRRDQASST